jgi:hypothetical protein
MKKLDLGYMLCVNYLRKMKRLDLCCAFCVNQLQKTEGM